MAVSGNVFYMDDDNREDFITLCGQLAGLINSASSDFENIVASSMINPWAKHKPFRYNDPNFGYNYNNPAPAETARAAARKSVNQGFDLTNAKIGSNGSVSDIASKYDGNMNGWVYLHPRGASVSPVEYNRIRDFDGYDHGALCFVQRFGTPARWAKDLGAFNVSFMISMPPEGNEDPTYLHHSDFPAVANAYIGVALIDEKGNISRMTADDIVSNAGIALNVPVTTLAEGTYTLYPFFSTKKLTFLDGGIIVSEQFTVPNVNKATLVLVKESITISISSEYLYSVTNTHTLSYTVTVYNNGNGERTLTNNWIRLRYKDKSWNDIMLNVEKEREIGTITIAAGSSYTFRGFFSGVVQDLYEYSLFWVSLHTTAYQQSKEPRQQMQPDVPDLEL